MLSVSKSQTCSNKPYKLQGTLLVSCSQLAGDILEVPVTLMHGQYDNASWSLCPELSVDML